MARSQETFNKKELQKKKIKERQEKAEKMQQRKANAKKGQSLEDMMAYLDADGNLTSTPQDPRQKLSYSLDDIQISVPKQEAREQEDPVKTGIVTFFNDTKGFGFIKVLNSHESVFVHVNQLTEPIREGDKVSFETQMGPKGASATNVRKTS